MKFPSKFISYKESSISKFPVFLESLQKSGLSVNELYKKVKNEIDNYQEFVEILDCLFMLGKININNEVIYYVEGN